MTYGVIVRHGEQDADYEEFKELPDAEEYYREKVLTKHLNHLPATYQTDEDAGKEIRIPVFLTSYRARCLRSYSFIEYEVTEEWVAKRVKIKIQLYQY